MKTRLPDRDPLPRAAAGVVLRRLAARDLEAFQAYRNDPEVGRFQGWSPIPDADAIDFLADMGCAPLFRPGKWCQIGIADRAGDGLIGDIGLCLSDDARHAEIGFTLRPESQGSGLATTAVRDAVALIFKQTDVDRVLAITDARNTPSISLLKRIGMRRRESRDAVFRGEPCVEHVYAMTRQLHVSRQSLEEAEINEGLIDR